MQLDSVMLYHLVKELRERIMNSQVRDVHQMDERMFDIELFCPDSRPQHLCLCAYSPTWIAAAPDDRKKKKYIPSQTFCMSLRKHLNGSRLSSIEQIHMDRIIRIGFDRIEDGGEIVTKYLYCELLPSAPNLVLTENGKILDSCIHSRKEERIVMPSSPYVLPKNADRMNFLDFTEEELRPILDLKTGDKDLTVAGALYRLFNGLNSHLTLELGKISGISMEIPFMDLTDENKNHLSHALSLLGDKIKSSSGLYIYKGNKGKPVVSAIPLSSFGAEVPETVSVNDWVISNVNNGGTIAAAIQELIKEIHSAVRKEERKIRKIKEELKETSKMEDYKLWGNLLSIYAYMPTAHKKSVTVDNLFVDPPVKVTISINPEFNMTDNSQLYFKKYNKMKTRLAIGQEKLEQTEKNLDYLKNIAFFAKGIEDRETLDSLREELREAGVRKQQNPHGAKKARKSKDPVIRSVNIDGYQVFIGHNNHQNEFLTLHKAEKNDIWLHAQKIPGSHVVIRMEKGNSEIPDDVLQKAASIAAWNSEGKDSGKVSVDYTRIKYVKKIPKGPPGLVNYTHQKTLVVKPEKE